MVSLSSFLWTKTCEDCRLATAWDRAKTVGSAAAAPADIEQILLYPSIQRHAGSLIFAFAAIGGMGLTPPAGVIVSPRGRCRSPALWMGRAPFLPLSSPPKTKSDVRNQSVSVSGFQAWTAPYRGSIAVTPADRRRSPIPSSVGPVRSAARGWSLRRTSC